MLSRGMDEIADRLKRARERAGYNTAADAVRRFDWRYPTYSGHENGHRGIKRPDLEKYSAAFDVPLEWLVTGKGDIDGSTQPRTGTREQSHGMAEADAVPFYAKNDRQRVDLRDLAAHLAPSARRVELFELRRHYPGLAMMTGDLLVVDTSATEAMPGQPVLSQIANEVADTGRTVLRLATAAGLIPPHGEDAIGPDEVEATIGLIIATIRRFT